MRSNVFLSLVLIFIITIASLVESNLGLMIVSALWIFICGGIINITFKTTRKISFELFFIFSIIYLLFMIISNSLYVDNPLNTYFFAPDSISGYNWANYLSEKNRYPGPGLFDYTDSWVQHGSGYFLITWILGRITYWTNTSLTLSVLLLQSVFIASLLNVVTYNIAVNFFSKTISRKITLIFGLCSPLFIYSAVYIRDINIALLYILGFYIIIYKFNTRRLIILFILGFITYLFRPQSGFLFLLFIFWYLFYPIYEYKAKNTKFNIRVFAVSLFGLIIVSFFGLVLNIFITPKIDNYQEYSADLYEEADGLTQYINKLPGPVKPLANTFISQINPFPFYRGLYTVPKKAKGEYTIDSGTVQYLSFPRATSALFWFGVWFIIISQFLKKKNKIKLPKALKNLFYLSLILLFIVTYASPEPRRILGVYPIIFLVAIYYYSALTIKLRRKIITSSVLSYLFILMTYLFLKM